MDPRITAAIFNPTADLTALLLSDPALLAEAKAEYSRLVSDHANGQIFDRCYVSKVSNDRLRAVLRHIGEMP